jgi:DNA-binding HxlR family transcriptional regulator
MKTITPIVKILLKDNTWRWGRSLARELYNITNQKNADRRLRELAEIGFIKKKYSKPTPLSREEVMYHR